jgi:Ras-related protein Rab-11A
MIGDTGVGKTNIVSQYTSGKFSDNFEPTIGCEFKAKTIKSFDDKVIRV